MASHLLIVAALLALPTASALRVNTLGSGEGLSKWPWSKAPIVDPSGRKPWSSRPRATAQGCVLTPTHSADFQYAQEMLRRMQARALDTVPVFVVVNNQEEANAWLQRRQGNAAWKDAVTGRSLSYNAPPDKCLSICNRSKARFAEGEARRCASITSSYMCVRNYVWEASAEEITGKVKPCEWTGTECRTIQDAIAHHCPEPATYCDGRRDRERPWNLKGWTDLAPHTVLTLEEISSSTDPTADEMYDNFTNFSTKLKKCRQGEGAGRAISHLKKLYGVRHLGQKYGCKAVWVVDSDSTPLRNFTFTEIFSHFGREWVDSPAINFEKLAGYENGLVQSASYSQSCIDAAANVHQLELGPRVQHMAFRMNDFALYDSQLVNRMIDDAVTGHQRARHLGVRSLYDAYLQGGQVSERILYLTWLAQGIIDGTIRNHTLVRLRDTPTSFAYGLLRASNISELGTKSKPEHFLEQLAASQTWTKSDFAHLGKLYNWLGQGAIRGLDASILRKPCSLAALIDSLPWCVSSCLKPRRTRRLITEAISLRERQR
mmetsp:Transcript_30407/g.66615  ORF Transcript_30407/g.66615 Transcript_30407/m.66615 type:complete len:546 (+) Transcript_30407:63-1700(+)